MRRHLSYANVTATLALFLAVSTGGAFAATKLIDSKAIKNNSITGTDIKDASIGPKDLSAAAKVSGPIGPKGDTGPAGAAGANGKDGANGALNLKVTGSKISTGTLTDLPFGTVNAGTCKAVSSPSLTLNEGNATIADDAVSVSPKTALPANTTSSERGAGTNQIEVTVCNVGAANQAVGNVSFNYAAVDTN